MGPSEVHKFLTSCLGLEKEQAKILTLDNRLSTLTDTETSLKSALESNRMGLEATQSAISSLGPPPVLETAPEALELLKTAHQETISNHKLIKDSQKKELDDLEATRPTITTVPYDRTRIEDLEKTIGTVSTQMAALNQAELERQSQVKAKIFELQSVISNLNNKELTRQSEVKNQMSAIRAEMAKIQGNEQTRQASVKNQISSLQVELIKAKATADLGAKAKEEAIALAKELQIVRTSVCPTCSQGWITDSCKAKEAQILSKLSEHKKSVIAGTEAQNKVTLINEQIKALTLDAQPRVTLGIDELVYKISELQEDLTPRAVPEVTELSYQVEHLKEKAKPELIPEVMQISEKIGDLNNQLLVERNLEKDHQFKENAKKQLIVDNYALKQTELRKQHENTLKFVQDAENQALASYQHAKHKSESFEENKKRFEESLKKLNDQLSGYSGQFKSKEAELALVQEEIELAQIAKKAIKSYLSCSFEDALDSIGDQATKLIRSIPNMSTASIQFEGLKETKEGKVKEEVTCVISMDGEIGIPVKSLSGGERSSTDLAIDLSVIKFIEERTGKGISLMILDEPFTGLDTTNVLEALEMLKECSLDKQLLIVDHNQVATQIIESKLTVVRDGLTSRVESK